MSPLGGWVNLGAGGGRVEGSGAVDRGGGRGENEK